MATGFENLTRMEYPGRVIIIGTSPSGDEVVIYAITARSPSSQARRLIISEDQKQIVVSPTNPEILETGNPDLLLYPSIIISRGLAVSNGKQTSDISQFCNGQEPPKKALRHAFAQWTYEPDAPNYTPRIGGFVLGGGALGIVKRRKGGRVKRQFFNVPRKLGCGKGITTYAGQKEDPLLPFTGNPLDVDLHLTTAEDAATSVFDALAPREGNADLRVSVGVIYRNIQGEVTMSLKNKNN